MGYKGSLALLLAVSLWVAGRAQVVIFTDDFTAGPSASWDNAVGGWFVSNGVYDAASPNNAPFTFSGLSFDLIDFSVTVDVIDLQDGGIWLRAADNQNGILLVTGGNGGTGTGLYWHEVVNGNAGAALNAVSGLFTSGVSDVTITVKVEGSVFSAFVNGSSTPATTLTSSLYTSGRVGLYDFSTLQTFDNFTLSVVPEPSTAGLLAAGLLILGFLVRRRNAGGSLR